MSDLDTARTILAFVRWLDEMPPAPGRRGDDAMAETAYNAIENATTPRLDELVESYEANHEHGGITDAATWEAIVEMLELSE